MQRASLFANKTTAGASVTLASHNATALSKSCTLWKPTYSASRRPGGWRTKNLRSQVLFSASLSLFSFKVLIYCWEFSNFQFGKWKAVEPMPLSPQATTACSLLEGRTNNISLTSNYRKVSFSWAVRPTCRCRGQWYDVQWSVSEVQKHSNHCMDE